MKANEEFTGPDRKLTRLTDEELEQVAGADRDITYSDVMQLIDEGKDRLAAQYFKLIMYTITALEAHTIRMAFWSKFGYAIDMYSD